jgi:hypothetical protein
VHFSDNIKLTYDHDYTLEPVNGDIYMVIRNPKVTVVPEKAYFHLTNLFGGEPVLGKSLPIYDRNIRSQNNTEQ